MKSLNFKKLNLQTQDVLSKTQMKKIVGGHTTPAGGCKSSACSYPELVAGGREVWHSDGTCAALGGIQTGCACNDYITEACNQF